MRTIEFLDGTHNIRAEIDSNGDLRVYAKVDSPDDRDGWMEYAPDARNPDSLESYAQILESIVRYALIQG